MKWIKCSEQMPELNKLVLLYDGQGMYEGQRYKSLFHDEIHWATNVYYDDNDPIYWAEYPEFPHE